MHFLVVGAGAAGLMAARELARGGQQVTVVEARDRCGGRIDPLPAEVFGYPAEGGPEFVHGAARVTRAVMREAGLTLSRRGGRRWSTRSGKLAPDEVWMPDADQFYRVLGEVKTDLPIADFLDQHFAAPQFEALRRSVIRTVEGYDAADTKRASTLALREEWMARDDGEHGRVTQGYGALIDFLAAECRRYGGSIHLGAAVTAIDAARGAVVARCQNGTTFEGDAVILSVPLPILAEIELPAPARERAACAVDIGYGNVVKFLLRFATPWWSQQRGHDLSDMSFIISNARVPTWWTQHPEPIPVLTGWFAGPRADTVPTLSEPELIEMGIGSLAEIFERDRDDLRRALVAARAINWGNDPFARGAYSYATPKTRSAQAVLRQPAGAVFFSGEALYDGPDMGTVEAALASGQDTAHAVLNEKPQLRSASQ